MAEQKTLYIIDGHAQFFRAFHAIRTPMTSPITQEPTNATFGFSGMLLKLFKELKPDYLVVAIDVSGDRETFRSAILPEYKATREPPPQTLGAQVERCVSLLEAIGVPVIGVEGVEADDVIASIAERLKNAGDLRIRIVSKDKDLMQLIDDKRVELYDVHTDELIDEAALKKKFGVAPGQVVDMLSLMGDTVDNIPGVEGVGQKTAAKLIAEWRTLEDLLAHAEEIKGKRGEKLREAVERLPISKELVTLKRDIETGFELRAGEAAQFRLERLDAIFQELGFNRRREELRELLEGDVGEAVEDEEAFPDGLFGGGVEGRTQPSGEYEIVRTAEELRAVVDALRKAEVVAIDTETTELDPIRAELCGLSFSTEAGTGWYVPVRSPEAKEHLDQEAALELLRAVLEDESVRKCGHNLKFDLLVLWKAGVQLRGIEFDSMIASYVVDAARSAHGLDALAQGLLGVRTQPISELIGTGRKQKSFDQVSLDRAGPYAAEDADIALRLRERFMPEIKAMKLEGLFRDVELPLVDALAELQWNGVRVDAAELDRQAERLNARIGEIRREISDAAPRPFNPDSPKQLSAVLFNKPGEDEPGLGLTPIKRTKTGYSTDVEVLEKLATKHEQETAVPGLIVEYRQLTKLVSTYLVALKEAINPETGRIHASFNQTVAATGRLSSSNPNLQNIPIRTDVGREIRRAFVAPEGRRLVSADYSQIELRVLAHLSRDAALIEAFQGGADIHRSVAAQINKVALEDVTREQRDAAKMVNFGIVYGITPFGLARRLRIEDKEAARIIDEYKARFPGITTFLQECVEQAKRKGYVETILKRRRPVPQVHSRRPNERALGERMAINSVVQGSAADLIKVAMLDLHRLLSEHAGHWRKAAGLDETPAIPGARMLLQIHDELLFEADESSAERLRSLVVERMESAMELRVPLVVESAVSETWFEGKG